MAITELYSFSKADLSTTEWSCTNNASYSTGAVITTDGIFQAFVDSSTLTATDVLRIRVYEKVRSSSSVGKVYESILNGVQTEPVWASPSLILMHGWDVTVTALSGTLSVDWSIRQVA